MYEVSKPRELKSYPPSNEIQQDVTIVKIELHRNVNSLYCESTFVKQSVFGIKVQYVEREC